MPGKKTSKRLWTAVAIAIGLAVLPLVGMVLAYLSPPGLITPPPMPTERIWPLLMRTVALASLVSIISVSAGTWLAWVEVRGQYRGQRLWSVLTLLPLAVPSYLLATLVREHLAPATPVGQALGLQEQFTGFGPALLVLSIACTPYAQLLVSAALRRCPTSEEEAARSLGASWVSVFLTVFVPRLRPTWAFSTALIALYVVSDFGAVAVLDCEVLTWELYKARGGPDEFRLALALLSVVVPILAMVRLLHGEKADEAPSIQRPLPRRALGPVQSCMTAFLNVAVGGVGVLIPAVTLCWWIWLGLEHQVRFAPFVGPAIDTLLLATFGALVVILITMAPAWAAARQRGKQSSLVEHAIYATSSLPGILVAVGLFQLVVMARQADTGGHLINVLEGTGFILIIAYATRFMAQAYAGLAPAMLRVNDAQVESARLLGAKPIRIFRSIVLPTIAPGAAAAYALLFVSIAKELPMTLMLIPTGHTTLAYRIFDAQMEGALPDIGAAGLTLLFIAVAVQLTVNRWRQYA